MDSKQLELQEKGKKLVNLHILTCASLEMAKIFEYDPDLYFEIENLPETDPYNENYSEIYEWWIIDKWLYEQLKNRDEAVLQYGINYYWGRQATGQSIKLDYVIQQIADEYF